MKKILFFAVLFLLTAKYQAQTSNLGKPYSFNSKVLLPKDKFVLPVINNVEKLNFYQEQASLTGEKLMQYGEPFSCAIDIFEQATMSKLDNGINLYQFVIESKNAKSLNLIFDEFRLEEGTVMYILSADKKNFIGAYTSLNNNQANALGTELLYSEKIVVEIQEPINNEGKSRLKIGKIIHGFIHLDEFFEKDLNSSGSCNIDVNCPQGLGWEIPRNSVAMMVNGTGGFCTGAMVNNTSGALIPYFLTANHCGSNPTNWVFRFRWESPSDSADCGTTSPSGNAPETMNINGAITRAKNAASDFHLVELNSLPLNEWEVVYSGWDRSETNATSGAGIHHPSGDIKKIAISVSPFESASYSLGGELNHWKAYWSEGVTQGGSSGSPLFNQQRRIVGQLHGGASGCNSDNQFDLYGKFSESWLGNGTDDTRLSNWLDPQNTGLTFIDGNVVNAVDPYLNSNVQGLEKTICGNLTDAKIVLLNGGTTTLTSATINYSINGLENVFEWTGNLGFHEMDTITLTDLNLIDGINTFYAHVVNPNNNQNDNNLLNNSIVKTFFAIINGDSFELNLNLDCYADETSWKLVDFEGNELFEGGNYEKLDTSYTIIHNFCLNEGCYDFYIFDSYGDGLTSADCDTGSYFIRNNSQEVIVQELLPENADFLYSDVQNFCFQTNNMQELFVTNTKIFPNPNSGKFNLYSSKNMKEIILVDLQGKELERFENLNSKQYIINSNLSSGVYFVQVKNEDGMENIKIIID
jgi:V8-like Glu-specific endopeptidase